MAGALIPSPLEKISLDEAYLIQERAFATRGGELAGWKLGNTSRAAQKAMDLTCPVAGRLSALDILSSGAQVELPAGPLYAEAELAVTVSLDLPPRTKSYVSHEIEAAIGPVYAAIELCTSRYADDDVDAPALVADNCFAHQLVLGQSLATGWNSRFKSMAVTLDCEPPRSVSGSTSAVMGNPIEAVIWLANWLSRRGEGLKRGQVIATGSCTGMTKVDVRETLRASFGDAEGAAAKIMPRRTERTFE